jgi:hypothetical protein
MVASLKMNAVLEYKDEFFLNSDFEITIDVSRDSNNGVFRRYHVDNNPVNWIDPFGLFSWHDLIPTNPRKVIVGIGSGGRVCLDS